MENAPAAEQQNEGGESLRFELEQGQEQRGGFGRLHIKAGLVGDQILEKLGVCFFANKPLGDAHAIDGFGECCGDAAEALGGASLRVGDACCEKVVEKPQNGGGAEDEREKNPVVIKHQGAGHEHLADLDDADKHHVLNSGTDAVDV